ncbi:hypothetical protein CYMTET_22572 [Cymbomonas tetramitiformis]|uniref:Uncharacterized protein n=1 Tax=Cymbomonas tetramitiformis TaxID=36881 RepID=A0AAE0L251_9CHLO|nr:hypothetical protein CYMTET_22572 [Cymbomonas tetramitiformis]
MNGRNSRRKKTVMEEELAPEEEAVVEEAEPLQPPPNAPEKDFWENENFDVIGKIAPFAGFLIAALGVAVGFFASSTYNEGAIPVDFSAIDSPADAVMQALEKETLGLLFYQAVRILSTLQQLQPRRPPAYVLENVSPLSHRENTKIRKEVFPIINSVVGQPVSFDAARAGSYTHRLRAYWSNLFQNHQFNLVMEMVNRPPYRYVSDILQRGWKPRKVVTGDRKPHHIANVVGEPMRVLPTILATQNSRAFRAPRAEQWSCCTQLHAEVSTTKLPKSQESEEEEHGALAAIPIVGSAEATAASGLAPEPVQAQLAEWVTRSITG